MSVYRATLMRGPSGSARPVFERLENRRLMSVGAPDPSFGSGGSVVTNLPIPEEADAPVAVLVEHDYKSIVVGNVSPGFSFEGGTAEIFLARYTTTGALDTSFGNKGTTLTNASAAATAAVLQSNGDILVVGQTGYPGGYIELARYTPSGVLDKSFGAGGLVSSNLGSAARADAVAIDAQGRIDVVGETNWGYAGGALPVGNLVVARYLPSGKLDSTFGSGGTQSFAGTALADAVGNSIVIDPSGKLVLAGSVDNNFFAARLNSGGALDSTFGSAGVAQVNFGGAASASSVALAAGGKIVLGGSNTPSSGDVTFALARLDSNGALDATFGTAGLTTSDFGQNSIAQAMTLQHDGKILLAGTNTPNLADAPNPNAMDYTLVARYNANGHLDTTFNHTGKTLYSPADPGIDFSTADAIAMQIDGKILVASDNGGGEIEIDSSIVLTRLLGDAPASVSGKVFNDANGNGILDAGEAGLANRQLYLDLNNDGVYDAGDYYVYTDAQGNFTFANLAPGTYVIREILPAGWRATSPAGATFTVTLYAGETLTGKNYGNGT